MKMAYLKERKNEVVQYKLHIVSNMIVDAVGTLDAPIFDTFR